MRAWLHDTLCDHEPLRLQMGIAGVEEMRTRVMPRRSEETINVAKPFLIYGLGNATSEQLSDATAQDKNAERQFFQVWIHDEGGDFGLIDEIVPTIIDLLRGASSPADKVVTIEYLETSGEFNNETYNTNFRYIRFQAIRTN